MPGLRLPRSPGAVRAARRASDPRAGGGRGRTGRPGLGAGRDDRCEAGRRRRPRLRPHRPARSDGFAVAADLISLQADAARLKAAARERRARTAELAAAAARHGELQSALEALDQSIADTGKHLAELTEQREARPAPGRRGRPARRTAPRVAAVPARRPTRPGHRAERRPPGRRRAHRRRRRGRRHHARADDARRAGDLAAQAAAEAGFADLEAARGARRDTPWRTAADQAIREHEASSRAVAELLADPDLDISLDPLADLAGAQAAVGEARRAHDDAVAAYDRATHKAEQLADLAPRLAARLDELKPLADRAAEAKRLADLAAGLGANTLRMTLSSFVLAARLEEVAAAASERLLKMTSGRYSLAHTDARRGAGRSGLGLLACDGWTGVDRDTSTLSGGETFLASLALALGLADVVTAEAGGTRIEALFVDEGFGSLDEDTLEEVMTVLDGLREGGRLVGIVSHVAELRQRIPAQVRVRKGQAAATWPSAPRSVRPLPRVGRGQRARRTMGSASLSLVGRPEPPPADARRGGGPGRGGGRGRGHGACAGRSSAVPPADAGRPGDVLLVPGYGGSTTALDALAGRIAAAGGSGFHATVVRLRQRRDR